MPTLFEYFGIIIKFYSNEHEPIHVHAYYNDAEIKVSFFIRDGKIYRTTYVLEHGIFPINKEKQLKKLIRKHKDDIVKLWVDFFVLKKDITPIRITKI